MSEAPYYRKQSEFAVRMADVATDPAGKARWLKVAQQWRELAEDVEGLAGPPKVSG